jgi:hypothetical protein
MSNIWGINLRKTGLYEERIQEDNTARKILDNNQVKLRIIALENDVKLGEYDGRQGNGQKSKSIIDQLVTLGKNK